jgi:selenide,water dikinase
VNIDSKNLPLLDGALENAAMGLIPGGLYRNKDYIGERCILEDSVSREMADIIFDPQTSGGLIIALPEAEAQLLLKEIKDSGNRWARIIGRVEASDKPGIAVR